MGRLDTIRAAWDEAARRDAKQAILALPPMSDDEFYASGRVEIDQVLASVKPWLPKTRDIALDFGCGIGRLTVALADHFKAVVGVDISSEMVLRAKPKVGVTYMQRSSLEDLGGRFDFIYSNITLQHMPADIQAGYIVQFVRLLSNDGLAVFEVPEWVPGEVPWSLYGLNRDQTMFGTGKHKVWDWVAAANGIVVHGECRSTSDEAMRRMRYLVKRA